MGNFLIIIISLLVNLIIDFKLVKLKVNKWYIINTIFQLLFSIGLIYIFEIVNINLSYITLLLIIFTFMFIYKFIFYFKKIKNNTKSSHIYKILIFLAVSVLIEIFICNFNFFRTLSYKPIEIPTNNIKTNMDLKNEKTVDNSYIEILGINKEIKNIFIDIDYYGNYDIQTYATDQGNKLYFQLSDREVNNAIEKSKYMTLNLNGKSEKIKFIFSFVGNQYFHINKITINSSIPLLFNIARCFLIFLIMIFIYFLRSKSSWYKIKLSDFKYKSLLLILLIIFNISAFSIIGYKAIVSYNKGELDTYNILAKSIKEGKFYFKDTNNSEEILNKMKNPYDTILREKIFQEKNKTYLWDKVFFKGKYYIYFGVVPAVLFFIPFNLIFHSYLSTAFIDYLGIIATIIFSSLLLYQLVKKFYKKCSIGTFTLLNLLLIYCSGLIYLMKSPTQYTLPTIYSLMFSFLGLNLWCGILKSNKLIKSKMFFGSLCLALVAGCRPQLILTSALIIPILISFYQENKTKLKNKDYIKYFITIAIPYITIAILLMYYNYIRFKSPFDFGSNYNLTNNDLTARGFKLARIPIGLVIYLFNPMNFQNVFPYITVTQFSSNYMGYTMYSTNFGGLFFTTMIYSLTLFLPKFKKVINNKITYYSCWLTVILAFIIVILDIEMGGIATRYSTDFTWLYSLATIIILLSLENLNFKHKEIYHKILFILISLALIYQFFFIFVNINNTQRFLEIYVKYLIQFWL